MERRWRPVTASTAPSSPSACQALRPPSAPGDAATARCKVDHRRVPTDHRARDRTESPPTNTAINSSSYGSWPNRSNSRDRFHVRGTASSDSMPTTFCSHSFRRNSGRQYSMLWCRNAAGTTRIRHDTCTGRSFRPRPRSFANAVGNRLSGMMSSNLRISPVAGPCANVFQTHSRRVVLRAIALVLMSVTFSRQGGRL